MTTVNSLRHRGGFGPKKSIWAPSYRYHPGEGISLYPINTFQIDNVGEKWLPAKPLCWVEKATRFEKTLKKK